MTRSSQRRISSDRYILYHEGSGESVGFSDTLVIYPKDKQEFRKSFGRRITGITVGAVTDDKVLIDRAFLESSLMRNSPRLDKEP